MEKQAKRILIFSFVLGIFAWIMDSCLDYFIFNKVAQKLTITEALSHQWYLVLFFIGFAVFCIKHLTKTEKQEEGFIVKEKILNAAQKMAHIGSWHLDIEKNTLVWSDEVYRIFGLPKKEFGATYEAFLEAVHPEDRELVDKTYRNAIKENKSYEIVHRIIRPDGEVRTVHEKSENIYDESGGTHSIGMVHDITETKKNEEEKETLISNLQQSVTEIKTLRGIIPICSFCKKIRDDKGYWAQVEVYMKQHHTDADFSHCVCPSCMEKYYPEVK